MRRQGAGLVELGDVSIRTRSFDRVMPDKRLSQAVLAKVSIRTRSFDRVMRAARHDLRVPFRVSIRTRSFDRVMPLTRDLIYPIAVLFQSAPGLSTG